MKLQQDLQKMMEEYIAFVLETSDKIKLFFQKRVSPFLSHSFEYLLFQISPYWHHLFYYILVSLLGYISLKGTNQRYYSPPSSSSSSLSSSYNAKKPFYDKKHHNLDLLFTAVSATTISSMSTIEMENFSNPQLMVIIILMFSGGEVFLSLLGLQIRKLKHKKRARTHVLDPRPVSQEEGMKYKSLRVLNHLVLGYLLVFHIIGYSLLSLYISVESSAGNVLTRKKLELHLFSIFTTVSTFSNCGFIPTNENMIVFKRNSGLLLILIPQILLGNKLYPCGLRLVIWVLERFTKKQEYSYLLKNHKGLGYGLLTSNYKAVLLGITSIGLVVVQFVVFSILEWNSLVLEGLSFYQKFVGSLFQTVNSRHSGESIIDVSQVSPATMLLFVVMMYLPSQTTFVPIRYDKESTIIIEEKSSQGSKRQKSALIENLKFSPLSYLAISIMLICITESRLLREDPLNFSVFNIIVEVVSAYGNVGFSMGYSCKQRLETNKPCEDRYFGFAGRWSWQGKFILILVMLFGRLKRFHFNSGKAWKLSL
nr:high-affinity potassium transporter 1 [Salicornia europaea]